VTFSRHGHSILPRRLPRPARHRWHHAVLLEEIGEEWFQFVGKQRIDAHRVQHRFADDLVRIVEAYLEKSDGTRSTMRRETPEEIELLSDNSASIGEPYAWTYFGQRVRIYPIPSDITYTVRLQLGPYRLAKIASTEDTNAWIVEAFDMIKARAKYVLYKDFLKDAALAAEALNDYEDHRRQLTAETSRRNGGGYIRGTCF